MLEGLRKMGKGGWGRTSSLVVEDTTEVVAVGEDVGLVGEIGAAGVDEVDAGETLCVLIEVFLKKKVNICRVQGLRTVLFRDSLSAQMLLHGDGIVCPALDPAFLLSQLRRWKAVWAERIITCYRSQQS